MPLRGGDDLKQVLNGKVSWDEMEGHLRKDVIMSLSGEILARKWCSELPLSLQND